MRRFSWVALTLLLAVPAAAQQRDTVAAVVKRPAPAGGTMRRADKVDTTVRLRPTEARSVEGQRTREVMLRELATEANVANKRRVEENDRVAGKVRADVMRRAPTMSRDEGRLAERPMEVFLGRPRIGVTVDLGARPATDRFGAYVTGVTPGGPADKGGIRTGDVITKLSGRSVALEENNGPQTQPGLRLIEMIAKLETGKPVTVVYRRDGDMKFARVTPIDDETTAYEVTALEPASRSAQGSQMAPWYPRDVEGGSVTLTVPQPSARSNANNMYRMFTDAAPSAAPRGGNIAFVSAFGGPLANLELAPINEKLGSYFGTSEGVLVIDVPEKDNMGLLPGDVITAIDGRKVSSPSQFMRVLRTYEKNEEFKLQVMRQKRQESISAKLP